MTSHKMKCIVLGIAFVCVSCHREPPANFAEHEKIIAKLVREKSEVEVTLQKAIAEKEKVIEKLNAEIAAQNSASSLANQKLTNELLQERENRREDFTQLHSVTEQLSMVQRQYNDLVNEEAQSYATALQLLTSGKEGDAVVQLESHMLKFPTGASIEKAKASLLEAKSTIAFEQRLKSGDLSSKEWAKVLSGKSRAEVEATVGSPSTTRVIECGEADSLHERFVYLKYEKLAQGADVELVYLGDEQVLLFPRKTSEWSQFLGGKSAKFIQGLFGPPVEKGVDSTVGGDFWIYEGRTLLAARMKITFVGGAAFAFTALGPK
jgi:hypothetical protein